MGTAYNQMITHEDEAKHLANRMGVPVVVSEEEGCLYVIDKDGNKIKYVAAP